MEYNNENDTVTLTYDELDDMYLKIENMDYQCLWIPSSEDIEHYVVGNLEQYLCYLLWVTETCPSKLTVEETRRKRYIEHYLKEHMILMETVDNSMSYIQHTEAEDEIEDVDRYL